MNIRTLLFQSEFTEFRSWLFSDARGVSPIKIRNIFVYRSALCASAKNKTEHKGGAAVKVLKMLPCRLMNRQDSHGQQFPTLGSVLLCA